LVMMEWVVHKCLTGYLDLKRIEPRLITTPAGDERTFFVSARIANHE